ncbi:methylated-DNA-protein-cysteine methyltransferase related protein [Desulfuromusa kysingii]|uniref:Methylated-DNA-protein-cysteine methyltransferase related protein n=1 Tax=Desulfuromusa kysingii TaxID=37625 RepID=A0A1H4CH51_9BACT|nr:MGMT family protein [Desulfuromusa kysingii]SEA59755.1 methylated-DNA-protein-cysteine methyltransferase related protein [Desulfuromusa kysingii]
MPQRQFSPLYSSIYALVKMIPLGYVSTYGQIARQLGCSARTVGFALAALPPGHDIPWQRVINSQGRVSPRSGGDGNILQQDLLETEGIQFDQQGRINLDQYGWLFIG